MSTGINTQDLHYELEDDNTRDIESSDSESQELVDDILDVILQEYPRKSEKEVVRQIRDIVNTNEVKTSQSDLFSDEHILTEDQTKTYTLTSYNYQRGRARRLATMIVQIVKNKSIDLDIDGALALIYATEFVKGEELELIEQRLRSYSNRRRKLTSSDQERSREISWTKIRDNIDTMLDHHEDLFDFIQDDVDEINEIKEEHIKSELRLYL